MDLSKIIQVIRKIPLFTGLSPTQMKALFGICQSGLYQPDEVLCESDTDSTEMFILLGGELGIYTGDGVLVATESPVTTVGEIGIITEQPRSATVIAVKASNVFQIRKVQFDRLIMEDVEMGRKIYKNVVDTLSNRLTNNNSTIRKYLLEREGYENQIMLYDRQSEGYQRRILAMRSLADEALPSSARKREEQKSEAQSDR